VALRHIKEISTSGLGNGEGGRTRRGYQLDDEVVGVDNESQVGGVNQVKALSEDGKGGGEGGQVTNTPETPEACE